MATKRNVARGSKPEKSAENRTEETNAGADMTLTKHAFHVLMAATIDSLIDEADSIRGIAQSLKDLGGMQTGGDPSELRSASGVVRAHAMGMLLSVAQIVAKSERIATMADVKAFGGAA